MERKEKIIHHTWGGNPAWCSWFTCRKERKKRKKWMLNISVIQFFSIVIYHSSKVGDGFLGGWRLAFMSSGLCYADNGEATAWDLHLAFIAWGLHDSFLRNKNQHRHNQELTQMAWLILQINTVLEKQAYSILSPCYCNAIQVWMYENFLPTENLEFFKLTFSSWPAWIAWDS